MNTRISSIRQYLPQILASSTKNLLVLSVGFTLGLPTVLIPALTGLNPTANPNEKMSITPAEASWIASLSAVCPLFGCLCTGILEPIGRRKSIMLCNIPYLTGWILLYYSTSLTTIYIGIALFGFAMGLMESAVFNYIGEICEPNIRGILSSTASLAAGTGMLVTYVLGNVMPWRNACLLYAAIPIIGVIAMLFIPETPQFLLSQNRPDEALKSLQWLRGWVKPNAVQKEFSDLQRYNKMTETCDECIDQKTECNHPPASILDRIRDLFQPKCRIPIMLVACQFIVAAFCSTSFRPYFVQVLIAYKSPIDPNKSVVWMGYVGLIANILLIFVVRNFGKRKIYLVSLASNIFIIFALGIYGFLYINADASSSSAVAESSVLQYFPVFGFTAIHFLNNFAVITVPNLLICEVFPFKSKAIASGLAAATYSAAALIAAKTFYVLEDLLTLPGQCMFYGYIGVSGYILVYLVMPETEGRSLEEVEAHFSNRNRKFNDIYISKISYETYGSINESGIKTNPQLSRR